MPSFLLCSLAAWLLSASCAAEDFIWGTATAAFQIEGSTTAGGRQPSIWDEFAKPEYGHIRLNATGDPADADYLFYDSKTVPLLRELGVHHYRMSISWTRVLQNQTADNPSGVENAEGIAHYIKVLNDLKANGIEPVVTMWHWDTPQSLEASYGGFRNRELMPKFFGEYAKVLVKRFGSLVNYWITLNEPLTVAQNGYTTPAKHAPGRCSNRADCSAGDDLTEPYQVAHTMIVSHGYAFRAFRELGGQGVIGITLNGDFCEPYNASSPEDVAAAVRCMEWQTAWFFDPIFFGDYPKSMRDMVGDRLPTFTPEERALVYGSHVGVYFQNLYTAKFVKDSPEILKQSCGYACDGGYTTTEQKDGKYIGPKSPANDWLYMYPVGFRKYQNLISKRYQNTETPKIKIIVSENGWGEPDSLGKEELLHDLGRCNYLREYIGNMSLAVHEDGVNVAGYFAWSLMDNFEWSEGYTTRFGLTYVDYKTQERTPKLSFRWFQEHVTPLRALPKDGILPECEKVGLNDIWATSSLFAV